MKLDKIGNLYKPNSENKLIIKKNKILSKPLSNLVNLIVDYIKLNIDDDYHSIYLRGSCLDLDLMDKRIFDIDINVICKHGNESFCNSVFLREHKDNIIKQMHEIYKFSIYPDIHFFSKFSWIKRPIHRLYSIKIDGEEDLSISSLDMNELFLYLKKILNNEYYSYMDKIEIKKKSRFVIKQFYRIFGGLELLNNGMFSRSIYYCHTALVKKYPQHSDLLEEMVDLFLNHEDIDNLIKYRETITSIYKNTKLMLQL